MKMDEEQGIEDLLCVYKVLRGRVASDNLLAQVFSVENFRQIYDDTSYEESFMVYDVLLL